MQRMEDCRRHWAGLHVGPRADGEEVVRGDGEGRPGVEEIRGWALREKMDREKEEEHLGPRIGPTLADAWTGRSGSDQQRAGSVWR